jgi:nucleoporin POM152
MNGTPRRGPGGFPTTPQTNRSPGAHSPNTSTPSRPNVRSPLPEVPKTNAPQGSGPLIPTDILDAAQQRFYVFALYVGLWAYRSYDFYTLAVDETESLWYFLKWCFLDSAFLLGVPLLEIPWLEWSNATALGLFALHAALDFMLMFRVGVRTIPCSRKQ